MLDYIPYKVDPRDIFKICFRCDRLVSSDNFRKDSHVCKGCMKISKKRRAYLKDKRENPAKYRAKAFRSYFPELSPAAIVAIVEAANGRLCDYCNVPLTYKSMSIDHKIPRSSGGPDSPENYQIICRGCNMSKGNFTDHEYRLLLSLLDLHPNIRDVVVKRLRQSGFMYHG